MDDFQFSDQLNKINFDENWYVHTLLGEKDLITIEFPNYIIPVHVGGDGGHYYLIVVIEDKTLILDGRFEHRKEAF